MGPNSLAGAELPSFCFPLGALATKTFDGGTAKEATVAEFPVSDKHLEIVLVLNNAIYQSISITAWMAANPDLLLATNFRVPEAVFAAFPKGEVAMPE